MPPDVEGVMTVVRAAQTVIDMHFLEHGYGTPMESYALACRVIQHLIDEGWEFQ